MKLTSNLHPIGRDRSGSRGSSLILALSMVLGGCSADPEGLELRPDGKDPPEVARALSVGGRLDESGEDGDKSIACAAALRLTAQKVGGVAAATGPNGQNLVVWASDLFRKRAIRAADAGASPAEVERSITKRMIQKRDDVRGQAQLSIACLRSLQGSQ